MILTLSEQSDVRMRQPVADKDHTKNVIRKLRSDKRNTNLGYLYENLENWTFATQRLKLIQLLPWFSMRFSRISTRSVSWKTQRELYGTQTIGVFVTDNYSEPRLWPVEDMEHLNDRREHMLLEPLDTTKLKMYDPQELKPWYLFSQDMMTHLY